MRLRLIARPPPRSCAQIYEKTPERVKNFGVWFRYESRTGTHNAYKEYRELALTDAINAVCTRHAQNDDQCGAWGDVVMAAVACTCSVAAATP